MIYKKNFGQNFLVSQSVAKRIVDKSNILPGETILEIGSGKGILTQFLLKKGAHVMAFEIDRDLFSFLKEKFYGMDVEFFFQDFLKFSGSIKANKCVSNIPYNISTPIIKKIFDLNIPVSILMVQKEYAKRLFASPSTEEYGSLSIFVQVRSKVEYLFDVDREAFYPKPKVDSSVIKITRTDEFQKKIKNMEKFEEIVRMSFSQRRKMIKNNLKGMESLIEKAGIPSTQRAEEIPIDKFIELSNLLSDNAL
ncbi:16S rRNA (adenine(1518)-N(6)/adenine(1519)-N(6))-dimethyltransferase RsmA [Athalassotoga saccharophila]|uniref:16S rRNA (adenine(1518)-N(6)/adenine(1519)-N(6))- dimethyltransferase RsmA n=1 Tax=Athalassotoga saccharophila TaxID=1441386 RepID=UPI0013798A5B|nr:16S rRNA (adenine(1518)-N(6)/adenine(1519)-N(6))-dimethyltransferase RsmA [Athalassotoga saccharophila]BBJ27654.1 ribosomal RNA small subunit methyltransferase A [Athalassotoga saccharophila]